MKKLNYTILSIVIIICSLLSGVIGSVVVIKYFGGYVGLNQKPEVIKQETTKTEKITSVTSLQNDITKIIKDISPSVVSIIIKKDLTVYRQDPFGFFQSAIGTVKSKVGGGSGFFISKDGKIITNKHVVSDPDAEYTVIANDGTEYDAKILALDPVNDLAILQINLDKIYEPLNLIGDKDELNVGEFVIAVGNALAEYQNSVSLGVLSGKNITIADDNIKLSGLLQTDAAINPGNSGGPLIDLEGKVIGINTAIVSGAEGLGFSIPLTQNRIDYMLRSIGKYGSIKRPFIGINYIINSPGIQKELGLKINYGAYISETENSVVAGSSAEKAGLKAGDTILEADGEKITLNNTLSSIIQTKIPGDIIKLKVMNKKGDEREVDLTLGEG